MSPLQVQDPWSSFNFLVEIEGVPFAGFCRVDGLESIVEVIEPEGTKVKGVHKRPVHQRVGNIILQRAASAHRHMWEWHRAAAEGRDDRRDGTISVLGDDGEVVMRIRFEKAWPCRWKLTALDALRSGVLIEEIELVIENLGIG